MVVSQRCLLNLYSDPEGKNDPTAARSFVVQRLVGQPKARGRSRAYNSKVVFQLNSYNSNVHFNTQKDNYLVFKTFLTVVQKEKIPNSKPTRLQKSVCLSKDSLLCRGHLEWGETKTKLAKG